MAGAVACCLLLAGGPATADASSDTTIPARLGLDEAERIFLERGLDLLIARDGAEAAEGEATAAAAHPNPGLDLAAAYTPSLSRDAIYANLGNNAPTSLWGFSVGLSDNAAISDQLSGKRSLRVQAAGKALAAARLGVDDVRRVGLGQLRQAYVAAVMAQLNLQAARESFETFDQQLALNRKRYDEGVISGLDLARATQAQLEALQTVDQAENGRRQTLAALLFLLGVRDGAPAVTLASGIDYRALESLRSTTLETLHAQALDHRPDVRVAAANLEQTNLAVRQAQRARVPDIALSLGYSEQCGPDTCSSQPAFSAGLHGNVPLLYQQQGEIKRAESNARAAGRALDKVKAQVLADVTQAFATYTAARSQVERMESKLLEQARVSRDLAQHMYQQGAASFIDFIDAQRAFVASRLEYHQDLANYWNAVYQLEQATAVSLR
ncbi:MAG TPA: TolC family protein [Polyangia bacterium]|nr:TolC family protein [Polyangia bacterium]